MTARQFLARWPGSEQKHDLLVDMACTHCGNRASLRIDVTIPADVSDKHADVSDCCDHEWDDESHCYCNCGKCGIVSEFTIEGLDDLINERNRNRS